MADPPEEIARLAERLQALDVPVPHEDGNEDPPESALAYDLAELERGSLGLAERIARFRESGGDDNWSEIREEIRHLLYHLQAPAFSDLQESSGR